MITCMPMRICTVIDTISTMQRDGDGRMGERRLDGGEIGAGQRGDEPHRERHENEVGDGRDALLEEVIGALLGGAEPARPLQRCDHCHAVTHPRSTPM